MDIKAVFEDTVATKPNNWVAALQKNVEFMRLVYEATASFSDMPLKDRIYAAGTGTSPVCKYGKMQTLENVAKGWKGCGRAGVCACAKEKVSSAIKTTKNQNTKNKIKDADLIPVSEISDQSAELLYLIENTPPKLVSSEVLKHAMVMAWVNHCCKDFPDVSEMSISERIYIAVHGTSNYLCNYGNRKTFNTLQLGYRYCGLNCKCNSENQSMKMTEHQAHVTPEERQRRTLAQQATLLKNYGVTNSYSIPGVPAKMRATNMNRYGVQYPILNKEIKAKITKTNMERFGVPTPFHSPTIQAKTRVTLIRLYGKDYMKLARQKFKEQTGFANPFEMQFYQDKATASMIRDHGVAHALQNIDILAQMQFDFAEKYNEVNPMNVAEFRKKRDDTVFARYNRYYVGQDHFTDEAYAILQDKDAFTKLFEKYSLREVSMRLGMSYDGARKYCTRYGIALPKSSYETAMHSWLSEYFEVKIGDRTIIKPKEIDLVIYENGTPVGEEPRVKLCIEFCGLYWHGDRIKENEKYHHEKLLQVNAAGHRLITIFEDEWISKQEIVKARLLSILGIAEKGVGARQTNVKKIEKTLAHEFCEKYHIQGGGKYGTDCFGAFWNDELVGVMIFGPLRFEQSNLHKLELYRFVTDGRSFPGLASKIFNTFVQEINPDAVITYADRRWSEGEVYRKLGFTEMENKEIGYSYVHKNKVNRQSRWNFQKKLIAPLVPDGENKTERQIMTELGYYRIYDCGNLKFEWKNPNKDI